MHSLKQCIWLNTMKFKANKILESLIPIKKLQKNSSIVASYIKKFNISSFTYEVEFQNFRIIVDAMLTPSPLLPTLSIDSHPIPRVRFQ
jgi:hypothetical protein